MLTQLNSSVLIPTEVNIEEWYCVGLGGGDFLGQIPRKRWGCIEREERERERERER